MTHIQCWCHRLRPIRFQVHHCIWKCICDLIVKEALGWTCLLEQTIGTTLPDTVPDCDAAEEWNNMACSLSGQLAAQRPDGLFVDWESRTAVVGEFSRRMDRHPHACTEIDEEKHRRYADILKTLERRLPGWTIRWAPFSVGVHSTIIKSQHHYQITVDLQFRPPTGAAGFLGADHGGCRGDDA